MSTDLTELRDILAARAGDVAAHADAAARDRLAGVHTALAQRARRRRGLAAVAALFVLLAGGTAATWWPQRSLDAADRPLPQQVTALGITYELIDQATGTGMVAIDYANTGQPTLLRWHSDGPVSVRGADVDIPLAVSDFTVVEHDPASMGPESYLAVRGEGEITVGVYAVARIDGLVRGPDEKPQAWFRDDVAGADRVAGGFVDTPRGVLLSLPEPVARPALAVWCPADFSGRVKVTDSTRGTSAVGVYRCASDADVGWQAAPWPFGDGEDVADAGKYWVSLVEDAAESDGVPFGAALYSRPARPPAFSDTWAPPMLEVDGRLWQLTDFQPVAKRSQSTFGGDGSANPSAPKMYVGCGVKPQNPLRQLTSDPWGVCSVLAIDRGQAEAEVLVEGAYDSPGDPFAPDGTPLTAGVGTYVVCPNDGCD